MDYRVYVDGRRVNGALVRLTNDYGETHVERADAGDLADGMLEDWLGMGGFGLYKFERDGGIRVEYYFDYSGTGDAT